MPVSPLDPEAKRTEIIEEFWLKSAEIRKGFGQTSVPLDNEQMKLVSTSIQTSCTTDMFYVSAAHTPSVFTSAPDSPSHTPQKTSGTLTQSVCAHITKTSSQPDLDNANAHVLSGSPSNGNTETPEPKFEKVHPAEDGCCLAVHRPDLTLEGHIKEESTMPPKSYSPATSHRVSSLLTPPFTPLVARQGINSLNAFQEREFLINSGSCAVLLKRDLLNRAQSLPSDEVEVLHVGNVDEAHPCPVSPSQLPFRSSVVKCNSTPGFLSKASTPPPHHAKKDLSEPVGRRTLSEAPVQVDKTDARQWKSEIKPLTEEKKKKHSSMFSPQKSKKSIGMDGERQQESTRHKSLWKSVFSVHKKDKKKREMESLLTTLPSIENLENRKRTSYFSRTGEKLRDPI